LPKPSNATKENAAIWVVSDRLREDASGGWPPPEVHLVILPMAFLLAISATAAKGSFATSQRISRQPVIRATNGPPRRTAGFGRSEGFGMVTTNLASKHI
jgi:hypothetical protein